MGSWIDRPEVLRGPCSFSPSMLKAAAEKKVRQPRPVALKNLAFFYWILLLGLSLSVVFVVVEIAKQGLSVAGL